MKRLLMIKKVISLQNKLIESHEKNVESVQNGVKTTVETEMKTYASIVCKIPLLARTLGLKADQIQPLGQARARR